MDWQDPKTKEITKGFKELGFMPEAFLNMLAMLGWNPGTEQEILSLNEMAAAFSMERVHKSGAKFDYEKAKWFNHEWIKKTEAKKLSDLIVKNFQSTGLVINNDNYTEKVIDLIKER